MVKRLLDVCAAEDLQVNGTTLETLYAAANGDIRLIMGQLQMIRLRHRTLSYDDAKVVVLPSMSLNHAHGWIKSHLACNLVRNLVATPMPRLNPCQKCLS